MNSSRVSCPSPQTTINRRQFLSSVALAGVAAACGTGATGQTPGSRLKLGIDNFAVRAFGWNAGQLVDYAASLRVDTLFITDLKPETFPQTSDGYLKDLRQKAGDLGVGIYLGSWSICPTSKSFKKDWGTAEEHLELGIRMVRLLGSPVFRVILGTRDDRRTPGGIEARIADTVKVLKSQRSRAIDAGVKVAVENHAGDMQAQELVRLIEEAGSDYVGANIDAGNATWTLEDPIDNLEVLGKYTVSSSLRDSMIWESEAGAKVQWTAMGEGCVDLKQYFRRFAELCPGAPAQIETISGFAVEFPYLRPEFWETWPKVSGASFARFLRLAKAGKALPSFRANGPEEERHYQKNELERSIRYCREELGLGVRR